MKFFETLYGKILLGVIIVAGVGYTGLQAKKMLGPSDDAAELNQRWLVCTETRKPYQKDAASVPSYPAYSPHSGKDTGMPAELCYWTAEGQISKTPTPVLLNRFVNEPEPTFCPDCGRLVIDRNPGPREGHPPPTKAEFEAYYKNRQ